MEGGERRWFTPEQERAKAQAYAQRDGFVTGFVRGSFHRNGAVGGAEMEQARREAPARYPIFATAARIVEDEDGVAFLVNRDGVIEARGPRGRRWWVNPFVRLTPARVRLLEELLRHPTEIVQTDL